MSSTDTDSSDVSQQGEEKPKLNLEVQIEKPTACERRVTVRVSRPDVERYITEAFDELKPKAEVPGFRPGRAPRKLVESRFREQVLDQVKGSLVMDSVAQVTDESSFSAISEPDFDFDAITLPDEGPFVFEFKIEVRPEFDLPEWRGLLLDRPVHEYSDEEVQQQLDKVLARHGTVLTTDEPVTHGDLVEANIAVSDQGDVVGEFEDVRVRVQSRLSFRDAVIEDFAKVLEGARSGESREATVTISQDSHNPSLAGKPVTVRFAIHDVLRTHLPKLTPEFLDRLGGFEDEDDLREAVRGELERRLGYHRQQQIRKQITAKLTETADWELPPDLVKRQARREFERSILELRAAGFSEEDIRRYANHLHRNSLHTTEMALKEHFILERIAEEQKLDDVSPEDYDAEIRLIAEQSDESPRRVRARLEKRGQMDALRNQILERKVIDLICEHASFHDVPLAGEMDSDEEALEIALAGGKSEIDIPEAKHGDEAQALREPTDHS